MRILILGAGGREHALYRSLSASPRAEKIFVWPGNGLIPAADRVDKPAIVGDFGPLAEFIDAEKIAMTVVGNETPLVHGVRFDNDVIHTETLIYRSVTGTVRRIGAEHRACTDRDVTSMAAHKMITRHEHVFGKARAENAQAVVSVWENAKKKERGEQTALERVLDVPLSLPALMRGQKIVRREAGAKGQTLDGAAMLARVAELAGQTGGDRAAQEARLGEMLECLCAAAEAQGLDAETALRGQTKKRVERLRAEDMGGYYRVACDSRDLNYDKFVVDGEVETQADESYTSHNTERLDVEGTIAKIKTAEYVQLALEGREHEAVQ